MANRAVCREDLTEGDNKLLLFADLRLLSPIVGYRRHFPRRRKRCPSFFNVFRLNGGISPEGGAGLHITTTGDMTYQQIISLCKARCHSVYNTHRAEIGLQLSKHFYRLNPTFSTSPHRDLICRFYKRIRSLFSIFVSPYSLLSLPKVSSQNPKYRRQTDSTRATPERNLFR